MVERIFGSKLGGQARISFWDRSVPIGPNKN